MGMVMGTIRYEAVPTIGKFMLSDSLVRGVMGPRGSGKSSGMSMEIMKRSLQQKPFNGIRKTRWAVIRNTYRELKDTTLKTWLEWFPENEFGDFNRSEMIHRIKFQDVETEILFRALDKPGDIKKLLSLELTGAWVNEAKEIPRSLINGLLDTLPRYPAKKDGGASWYGVIMDTNPPDTDHWWYKLSEQVKPEGWEFWRQPGGIIEEDGKFFPNPEAENIENLSDGYDYYLKKVSGAARDHILVYYCGQYGFVREGKPVYPEYYDNIHCPGEEYKPTPGIKIFGGIDFGLTPAFLFTQRQVNGRWIWFDELVTEIETGDMGIQRFSELLKPKLNEYADWEIEIYGDPAGSYRVQTDESTCYQILAANQIKATPTASNDFTLRREAVATSLRRLIDGKPGLMISPKCKMARLAMAGNYHFKRIEVSGEERYHDEPNKNKYSHVAEAGQYAMLGGGEGNIIMKYAPPNLLKTFRHDYSQSKEHGWML